MTSTLLTVCGWVLAAVMVAAIVVYLLAAWGGLAFRELPLFSEGEEPTTVKRLPEIDLPLDLEDE